MTGQEFDEVINRLNTGCRKWDALEEVFGAKDILPLWIADMDFAAVPAIRQALVDKANHGIYGYNTVGTSFYEAPRQWVKARHQWEIEREWIQSAPGVVPSINFAIQAFTVPGDEIIIQTPVYPPFFSCILKNKRQVVENPLLNFNGHYEMDFADLERKITPKTKMLLFCSPHNPVGRVWTKAELLRLSEICLRHKIIIVADEIHSDLIYSRHKHIPLASLSPAVSQLTVTCISPSKTFNIAGLYASFMITADPQKRSLLADVMEVLDFSKGNLFAVAAVEAAYYEGAAWLDRLLPYLESNADYTANYLEKFLPEIKVKKPEGTYLAWLDFTRLFQEPAPLKEFLIQRARVGLNDGATFGKQGAGFSRLNFACPRSQLHEGLERIKAAMAEKGVFSC